MRNDVIALVAIAAVASSGAAFAQPAKPAKTSAQIVCEISGDCGNDAPDQSQKVQTGKEAGFTFLPLASARKPQPVAATTAAPVRVASVTPVAPQRAKSRPTASHINMQVTFKKGSSELTGQARINAEEYATAMLAPSMADRRFVIEGHTDAAGTREYNLKLSQARAESVAAFLKDHGVSADRIEAKGYGFDRPLSNFSPRAPANRRVEFVPVSATS